MNDFTKIPDQEALDITVKALESNGISALVVENGEEAKEKVLSLIPENSEVMTMTSVTLDTIGLSAEINESGKYDSVKTKLTKMNRETDHREMQSIGAAPEYAVGSVHAVTQNGQVLIASNTGSQLAAYSYGANHVIWVVGAQKIVKNLEEGFTRIHEHILPQESVRARKAYGLPDTWHSNVSKLLTVSKEVNPDRIILILVKEKLGF